MEENQMIITYFSRECVRWWKWWRSTGSVCVVQFLATRGCRLPACILCPLIFAEAAVKHLVGGDFTQRYRLTRLSKYRAVCWRAEHKHDTNTDLKYPVFNFRRTQHNTTHSISRWTSSMLLLWKTRDICSVIYFHRENFVWFYVSENLHTLPELQLWLVWACRRSLSSPGL